MWSPGQLTHFEFRLEGYFTSPGIGAIYKGPTAFSVYSERHRDKQSLMLRARFLHQIMTHVWSGIRTPVGRVTSGRANHYTTAPRILIRQERRKTGIRKQ